MRGKKNPPLEFVPVAEGAPITYDSMAQAYLEEYVLHCYKTLTTARARADHLRAFFGGWNADAITPDSIRNYQKHRRAEGAEASTVNRETSGLSRMFQLAIRRGSSNACRCSPSAWKRIPRVRDFSSTRST